jgi:hypothetical protein
LKLRVRGHAPEGPIVQGRHFTLKARVNGVAVDEWTLDRHGLFVLEADLPDGASEYRVEIIAEPEWRGENDQRVLTVTLSMLRLVPQDDSALC